MLSSLDGKISTGDSDVFGFDFDLPKISGIAEGFQQYRDMSNKTDCWIMVTGRAVSKACAEGKGLVEKTSANLVLLDNTHVTFETLRKLSQRFNSVIVATNDSQHCAYKCGSLNVIPQVYPRGDLKQLFQILRAEYGCNDLTVRVGGTVCSELFHCGLVDYISLVVAPLIVGGRYTPTLVDGFPLSEEGLEGLCTLRLLHVTQMDNNYVHLHYAVVRKSRIVGGSL